MVTALKLLSGIPVFLDIAIFAVNVFGPLWIALVEPLFPFVPDYPRQAQTFCLILATIAFLAVWAVRDCDRLKRLVAR